LILGVEEAVGITDNDARIVNVGADLKLFG
jgi:hypothetical protein